MKEYTKIMMLLGVLAGIDGFVQAVVSPTNDEIVAACAVTCDAAKSDAQSSYAQKVCTLPEKSQAFLKELGALSLAQRAERIQQVFAARADYFSKLAKAATREAKKALNLELAAQLAALDELALDELALDELALLDIYLESQLTEGEENE